MIQNNGKKEERMFFGVEDPTTASAVLDVAAGEEYPIHLLVAASSIYDAEHGEYLIFVRTYNSMFGYYI